MEWLDPAKQKPDTLDYVLLYAYYDDFEPFINLGWYEPSCDEWHMEIYGVVTCLAWMPLPEPPKGDYDV